MNDQATIMGLLLRALNIEDPDEIIEVFLPPDGSPSKAKPFKTYKPPVAPTDTKPTPPADGQAPADGTLTPDQQAAQKNQPTKPPKVSSVPEAPKK
jgi:hypothetical protein